MGSGRSDDRGAKYRGGEPTVRRSHRSRALHRAVVRDEGINGRGDNEEMPDEMKARLIDALRGHHKPLDDQFEEYFRTEWGDGHGFGVVDRIEMGRDSFKRALADAFDAGRLAERG